MSHIPEPPDPNNIQTPKVSIDDFDLLDTIGLGSYGRVRLGRNKKTNKVYAIKILKKHQIIKMKQVDQIYSEYLILSSIYHPFIVEIKAVNFSDPTYLYFVQDYIPGGELFSLLRKVHPSERRSLWHHHSSCCSRRTCCINSCSLDVKEIHKEMVIYRCSPLRWRCYDNYVFCWLRCSLEACGLRNRSCSPRYSSGR